MQAMGAFGLSANESAEAAKRFGRGSSCIFYGCRTSHTSTGTVFCWSEKTLDGLYRETTAVLARFADAGIEGSDAEHL